MPSGHVERLTFPSLPGRVVQVLRTLTDAGHEAALVGGCVRDRLLGLAHAGDWDLATSAHPEEVAALFPGSAWENRFGTVTVGADPTVEITSYRTEGAYRDRRRPDDVRFGATLDEDLARRDFTINAVAWVPIDLPAGVGALVDPFGGARDLEDRVLRTVGDPRARFGEDALRLLRAVRFASHFGLALHPETSRAIVELAPAAASVSAERTRDELLRVLRHADRPSDALRLLEDLGLLAIVLPEVAALRGVPQAKRVPGDALDHTFATVDAAPATADAAARLAALLHDVGKPSTMGGGHFIGHDAVGARMAAEALARLRVPRSTADRVVGVIGEHMFNYEPEWTDAAVRRFIRRTHAVDRDLLFALRRADDVASGAGDEGAALVEDLERRIAAEVAQQPDLFVHRRLAVDGHDLQSALALAPGPLVGELLDHLAERVVDDPSINRREELLRAARERLADR